MSISTDYILYSHNTTSIKDIQSLVDGMDATTICYGWDVLELLSYQDENNKTNLEKIWEKYNAEEKKIYEKEYNKDKLLVELYNQNPKAFTPNKIYEFPTISNISEINIDIIKTYPDPTGDTSWVYKYINGKWWGYSKETPEGKLISDGNGNSSILDQAYPNAKTENEDKFSTSTSTNTKVNLTLLKIGTELAIPTSKVNVEVYSELSNQVVTGISTQAYIANSLKDLLEDPDYKPIIKNLKGGYASYKSNFPNVTVWIWCRALTFNGYVEDDSELQGLILNVSPFIESITTNQSSNGGSFSINLTPLICYFDYKKGWLLKTVAQCGVDGTMNYLNSGHISSIGDNGDSLKRSIFYFNTVLSENDIVFIRFETLRNEIIENHQKKEIDLKQKQPYKEKKKIKNRLILENELIIPRTALPDQIYDMIGLIDNNSQNLSPAETSITITGRDLWKLLVDDGCYFYPLDFVPGGIFANETDEQYLDRIDGKLVSLCQYAVKSIDFTLKFIINNLSKIKICPNSLFDEYKDDIKDEDGNIIKMGRSKNFKLDLDSRKLKLERERELEELRGEIFVDLNLGRSTDGLEESVGEENTCFLLLKKFIEFLIDNDFLINSEEGIGWTIPQTLKITQKDEFEGEIIKTNTFPSCLDDLFYKKLGTWEDTNDTKNKMVNSIYNNLYKEYLDLLKYKEDKTDNLPKSINDLNTSLLDWANKQLILVVDPTGGIGASTTGVPVSEKDRLKAMISDLTKAKKELKENWVYKRIDKYVSDMNMGQGEAFEKMINYISKEKTNKTIIEKYVEDYMSGIWQIVKLLIDDDGDEDSIYAKASGSNIGKRRIVDSTIGNENGSILTAIQKLCQEPFVEFYGDTIGDQYFLIARQPPFLWEDIRSIIDKNYHITIEEEDILNSNLSFENGSSYSWYRLEPKNLIEDLGQDAVTAYLKAVHFKEIADIFGEKPLEIVSNYLTFHPIIGKEGTLSIQSIMQQAILDLQFIVKTNQYLPFTRSGNITINGDRRIKKGSFIYLKGTDEIYYVESVTHNLSISDSKIERTTQLQISRGMVKSHLNSYFNIINTEIPPSTFNSSMTTDYIEWMKKTYGGWKVDKKVLNFFLQKNQFRKSIGKSQVIIKADI